MNRAAPDGLAFREFQAVGGLATGSEAEDAAMALAKSAPSLWRLVLREPSLLDEALELPLWRGDDDGTLRRVFEAAREAPTQEALNRHLRRGRHRTVLRIALRELLRLADIDHTSFEMAHLASVTVDTALTACRRQAEDRYGYLKAADGEAVSIVVLGMGKLGGGELNLGSDIDLSFFYGSDDGTSEDGHSAYEFVSEVVSQVVKSIGEVTDDGFAFRVDLRLRPEGSRGPIASSLDRALRYYESWGRGWERAVLLRAQPVAGDLALGRTLLQALDPFIYRRSVDPSIATEMRRMLETSRREARGSTDNDLKIGRGGIREAEFFVQTLQLIWGGRFPELRVSATIEAIRRLVGLGHLSSREAEDLEADWALLRRVEHRLHLQAGYQTHALPRDASTRTSLATSLGFDSASDLDGAVAAARERVALLFDSLEAEEPPAASAFSLLADSVAHGDPPDELRRHAASALPVDDLDAAVAHLRRLGARATSILGPATRDRYPTLGPRLLDEIARTVDPDAALRYSADFFSRLGGSWGLERTLLEHPRRARRLVGLLGGSSSLASTMVLHPEWITDLTSATLPIDPDAIVAGHDLVDGEDAELVAHRLRQLKVETTLRVGLAWVGEEIDLTAVQRHLTALAEAQLNAALRLATLEHQERRQGATTEPDVANGIVILGLGKLGGGELGFGSDLDVVFLYDSERADRLPDGTAFETFTRIAQRTMRLLSQPEVEGPGYEVDTRLRPRGSQGMLVVSTKAFARYHKTRAAAWERLALIKARAVAGPDDLRERADILVDHAAYDGEAIEGADLAELRGRIEREVAGERSRHYHAKVGFGSLLDVEFVVQFHQLRHRGAQIRHPHTGAALEALAAEGVFPAEDVDVLSAGHEFFRRVEQTVRFLDERADPLLAVGGRRWHQVVRGLGVRDRDGMTASEVLDDTWRRHATGVRRLFERRVGPVGTEAPWTRGGATR